MIHFILSHPLYIINPHTLQNKKTPPLAGEAEVSVCRQRGEEKQKKMVTMTLIPPRPYRPLPLCYIKVGELSTALNDSQQKQA